MSSLPETALPEQAPALWQMVFRQAIAPQFSTEALYQLLLALQINDDMLVQGMTSVPPPLMCFAHEAVRGCCPVGFLAMQQDRLHTVEEVENAFALSCFQADQRLGEPGGMWYFLNQVDEWDRATMRRELGAEVERELARRHMADATAVFCEGQWAGVPAVA